MSRGFNRITLVGHVGNDPESMLTGNTPMTKISVAINNEWKDKEGNLKKETQWFRVVCFKKLADLVCQYVKKGSQILIEGSLKNTHWKDKETGEDKYATEIYASTVQFLGAKNNQQQNYQEEPPLDNYDDIPF